MDTHVSDVVIGVTGVVIDPAGNRTIAGAGKDTFADRFVDLHRFAKIALADPIKRFAMDLFGFSYDQLWGPSESRNAPDLRYTRPDGQPLTPRYVLEQVGTECVRDRLLGEAHVHAAVRTAQRAINGTTYPLAGADGTTRQHTTYQRYVQNLGFTVGYSQRQYDGVVVPDMRFTNEAEAFRRLGGTLVRVVRYVDAVRPVASHASDQEILSMPDSSFDYTVVGVSGFIASLQRAADLVLAEILIASHPGRGLPVGTPAVIDMREEQPTLRATERGETNDEP